MKAIERLVNGYFALKEEAEKYRTAAVGQMMHLSSKNKDLEKKVARLERQIKKSNTEIITDFINRFAEDKLLTEQQHQMLLSYVREVNKEDEEEEEDDNDT